MLQECTHQDPWTTFCAGIKAALSTTRVGQSRCCSSTVHSLVKGWELSVHDLTDSVGKAVGSLSDMRACRRLGMKMGVPEGLDCATLRAAHSVTVQHQQSRDEAESERMSAKDAL